MNYLSGFLTAVCASAVFIGALYMICPEGSMNKSVTYLLGLVFILCVTAASGVTVKNADFTIPSVTVSEAGTEEGLKNAAEFVYKSSLKSSGIDFKEITVCTNNLGESRINISKIRIVSDAPKEKIIAALGEAAKTYEVEIVNE